MPKGKIKVDNRAASLTLIKGQRVLLQLRDNISGISYPGFWSLIGGRLKKGERPKEGVIREFKEETGYISANPIFFMTEIYRLPNGKLNKEHRFLDFYDGKQKIKCLEGQKMEFKTLEEIDKLKIVENHKEAVKKALLLVRSDKLMSNYRG